MWKGVVEVRQPSPVLMDVRQAEKMAWEVLVLTVAWAVLVLRFDLKHFYDAYTSTAA